MWEGGTSPNFRKRGSAHNNNKKIQSDLNFSKNEGSIRSKTNEKGGQLDRKLIQNGKDGCKILKTCLN